MDGHGDGPPFERPAWDLADTLRPGALVTEAERHRLVREGFLAALFEDPRTAPALQAWGQAIVAALPAPGARWDRVGDAIGRVLAPRVGAFVQQLRIPVEWQAFVIVDLADAFLLHVSGHTATLSPRPLMVEMVDAIAPPITLRNAKPKPGETFSQARERLLSSCATALGELVTAEARLVASVAGAGKKAPRKDVDYRTWGRWLYQAQIQRQTLLAVAREHHKVQGHERPFEDCNCRKPVRNAITKGQTAPRPH